MSEPTAARTGHRHLVKVPGHEPVTCWAGEHILDALLEHGVAVGYGCFTGSCGRCLARIVSGKVVQSDGCSGITELDRERGMALLCQARPASDVVVEPAPVDEGIPFIAPARFTGRVSLLEDVAPGTRRLRIRLDRPLQHLAGQYLRLEVPGCDVPRAYSIATPPAPDGVGEVELHIRRVAGGAATDGYVFAGLRVGDTVRLRAPYGRFVLHPNDGLPMLFIAGGTGLAPIIAIVRAAIATGLDVPMVLYHGARTRAELYEHETLRALAAAHPRLDYRPVLSDESWEGRTGLVTEAVERDYERLRGWAAYVCGPPVMVEAAVGLLTRLRVPGRLIYREDFY